MKIKLLGIVWALALLAIVQAQDDTESPIAESPSPPDPTTTVVTESPTSDAPSTASEVTESSSTDATTPRRTTTRRTTPRTTMRKRPTLPGLKKDSIINDAPADHVAKQIILLTVGVMMRNVFHH